MEKEILIQETLSEVFKGTPHLLKFPVTKKWIDYDKEADVLYISFDCPQRVTDSEMTQNGILHRYRGAKLVSITIIEASKRNKS